LYIGVVALDDILFVNSGETDKSEEFVNTMEVYNSTPIPGPWKHCQEATLTSVFLVE